MKSQWPFSGCWVGPTHPLNAKNHGAREPGAVHVQPAVRRTFVSGCLMKWSTLKDHWLSWWLCIDTISPWTLQQVWCDVRPDKKETLYLLPLNIKLPGWFGRVEIWQQFLVDTQILSHHMEKNNEIILNMTKLFMDIRANPPTRRPEIAGLNGWLNCSYPYLCLDRAGY